MSDFLTFWQLYPRKEARKHAAMMFSRLTPEQQKKAIDVLPAHIKRWAGEGRMMVHIPHAGSWINGERFDDEIATPQQLVYTVNTAAPLPPRDACVPNPLRAIK